MERTAPKLAHALVTTLWFPSSNSGTRSHPAILQMNHRSHFPFSNEILRRQSAVTVLGGRLAAKQDGRHMEQSPIDRRFHLSLAKLIEEPRFVLVPCHVPLLVGVEDLLRGRQDRQVKVLGRTDLLQEVPKIVPLGEGGQLRRVVQSHVDESLYAGPLEDLEELGGAFFGKTDCVDFHSPVSSVSNRVNCPLVLRKC